MTKSQKAVTDLRKLPMYPFAEAARIAQFSPATLRKWFPGTAGITFLALFEAYIVRLLKSEYPRLSMKAINKSLQYMRRTTGQPHPFAVKDFRLKTDGRKLFFDYLDQLICATESGQIAMEAILDAFLERVEYADDGLARRFFPFTRGFRADGPKLIVVDPNFNFGRPCLAGRAISTAMIASRNKAGDSREVLAEDYRVTLPEIDEAIRAEIDTQCAA